VTGRALLEENEIAFIHDKIKAPESSGFISIRDARANNLKGVDVDIPKEALTVVTGVSGSGKSSLVGDVLETEAKRRFLETLSMYERQGTKEGAEASVGSVTGLGVSMTVTPDRRLYDRRSTVGTATEIWHHLAVLLATVGESSCPECGMGMERNETWICPACGAKTPKAEPRHFSPLNYAAACATCQGVGSLQKPNPDKLIVRPDLPLCGGAMYSPGFFPKGYLCRPGNHGYYIVRAVLERFEFDPAKTPWNEMTTEAQEAFLFGDPEPLTVSFRSHSGRTGTREVVYPGFYGWVRDWDIGGTYTDNVPCPDCSGRRLRPQYLAVTLGGYNIHELSEMPLSELEKVLEGVSNPELVSHYVGGNLATVLRRLGFLLRVGLGYLKLNRVSATLSAGEAQRVKLAGLLDGGLTSLTVLLDEPSRGMHPSELEALLGVLGELRDKGNTVVVVEHDPVFIRAADHLVDMGPGAGVQGGEVVAEGSTKAVSEAGTVTGKWLRGERAFHTPDKRREPQGWLTIEGAAENNLKGEAVRIPLGVLVGICGVSGSGKSTLLIDTLGRALAPRTHTTSVAREPLKPGRHDSIEGAPAKTILVDQAKAGIRSPAAFLALDKRLHKLYAGSEDAAILSLDVKDLGRKCSVCHGRGSIRTKMGFLPDIREVCEVCKGTGYLPEAWEVTFRGLPLPRVDSLTLEEVHRLFGDDERLARPLKAAMDVGLGYLVMRQPGYALSGGEVQRLKIAKELSGRARQGALYILDEPTVGQHMEDVSRLAGVLHRLVDGGHSVVVVEHHSHLLASCDWLLELGPGGGPDGGRVIASGTPETLAMGETPTATYLREALGVLE
jgi:excinuclease ABC subunit A